MITQWKTNAFWRGGVAVHVDPDNPMSSLISINSWPFLAVSCNPMKWSSNWGMTFNFLLVNSLSRMAVVNGMWVAELWGFWTFCCSECLKNDQTKFLWTSWNGQNWEWRIQLTAHKFSLSKLSVIGTPQQNSFNLAMNIWRGISYALFVGCPSATRCQVPLPPRTHGSTQPVPCGHW